MTSPLLEGHSWGTMSHAKIVFQPIVVLGCSFGVPTVPEAGGKPGFSNTSLFPSPVVFKESQQNKPSPAASAAASQRHSARQSRERAPLLRELGGIHLCGLDLLLMVYTLHKLAVNLTLQDLRSLTLISVIVILEQPRNHFPSLNP